VPSLTRLLVKRVRRRILRNRVIRAAVRARWSVHRRSDLVRLGSEYGGWWVPENAIAPGARAYCAGVGNDITFDLALVDRYGCEVWAFDPTPAVVAAVTTWSTPAQWHFEPVGLWDRDDVIRFYAPSAPGHGSLSATNAQGTAAFIEAPVEALPAIMRRLGHDRIDILKMDIEGAEGRVLAAMLRTMIRPKVVCVEFDQPEAPWRTRRRIRELLAAGYVLNKVEYWNYTFLRLDAPSTGLTGCST
jgi:FkbM family methyltransferase